MAGEESGYYLKDRYDIKVFNDNTFSLMTEVTARLHNNFIRAVNENVIFPKAIIFVIDGDIIKTVSYNNYGISEVFGKILKNLMVGIHRTILSQKEKLQSKSKRLWYPSVLWALAPQHTNFPGHWNNNRRKFNDCIESLVTLFPEMKTLKMKKFWEYNDLQLVINRNYMAQGLNMYWKSIDSAFRHWDTFVFGKPTGKGKLVNQPATHRNPNFKPARKAKNNPEHRHGNDFIRREVLDYQQKKRGKRLPTPPL